MSKTILKMDSIDKIFPGIKALNKVNIEIEERDIHALVGENGAGKSTLMSVLGGVYRPDGGKIILDGEEKDFHSPQDAYLNGISLVHQELSLFPYLSVAENIYPNRQPLSSFRLIDVNTMNRNAKNMLSMFDIKDINPNIQVKYLSIAQQQVVEILKAMSFNPKVLILDEPTSSLTEHETKYLFKNLKLLNKKGITIIYISHHLKEIFEICNRVTVLKDGKYICTEKVEDINEDFLITKMTGKKIVDMFRKQEETENNDEVIFQVKNLCRSNELKNISFSVNKSEILGFYGLVGSGRTEMARAIFGVDPIDHGELVLNGKKLKIKNPEDAIKKGIGYMTEDRKMLGLYLNKTVSENFVSNHLFDFSEYGFMNDKGIDEKTADIIDDFHISTSGVSQKVNNLSGGNQQKLLLATWFGINPKLIIIDEPTRGVDVGARFDIYQFIRNLNRRNVGIIVISSDILEVLGISDRIIVMKDGEIVGDVDNKKATEDNLIAIASGLNINERKMNEYNKKNS